MCMHDCTISLHAVEEISWLTTLGILNRVAADDQVFYNYLWLVAHIHVIHLITFMSISTAAYFSANTVKQNHTYVCT